MRACNVENFCERRQISVHGIYAFHGDEDVGGALCCAGSSAAKVSERGVQVYNIVVPEQDGLLLSTEAGAHLFWERVMVEYCCSGTRTATQMTWMTTILKESLAKVFVVHPSTMAWLLTRVAGVGESCHKKSSVPIMLSNLNADFRVESNGALVLVDGYKV